MSEWNRRKLTSRATGVQSPDRAKRLAGSPPCTVCASPLLAAPYPNIHRQTRIAASAPVKSAIRPTGMACRVRVIFTEPK